MSWVIVSAFLSSFEGFMDDCLTSKVYVLIFMMIPSLDMAWCLLSFKVFFFLFCANVKLVLSSFRQNDKSDKLRNVMAHLSCLIWSIKVTLTCKFLILGFRVWATIWKKKMGAVRFIEMKWINTFNQILNWSDIK